jgi:hypothetical protein
MNKIASVVEHRKSSQEEAGSLGKGVQSVPITAGFSAADPTTAGNETC